MNNLGIPNPDMMYEAVPENLQVGFEDIALDTKERTLPANETLNRLPAGSALCIDLRRQSERKKNRRYSIIHSCALPEYESSKKEEGLLSALSNKSGQQLLLCRAFGEKSALAFQDLKN